MMGRGILFSEKKARELQAAAHRVHDTPKEIMTPFPAAPAESGSWKYRLRVEKTFASVWTICPCRQRQPDVYYDGWIFPYPCLFGGTIDIPFGDVLGMVWLQLYEVRNHQLRFRLICDIPGSSVAMDSLYTFTESSFDQEDGGLVEASINTALLVSGSLMTPLALFQGTSGGDYRIQQNPMFLHGVGNFAPFMHWLVSPLWFKQGAYTNKMLAFNGAGLLVSKNPAQELTNVTFERKGIYWTSSSDWPAEFTAGSTFFVAPYYTGFEFSTSGTFSPPKVPLFTMKRDSLGNITRFAWVGMGARQYNWA